MAIAKAAKDILAMPDSASTKFPHNRKGSSTSFINLKPLPSADQVNLSSTTDRVRLLFEGFRVDSRHFDSLELA